MSIGRNEPCPCGSGKKYKKCCLARDRAAVEPRLRVSGQAVRQALDWLYDRHSRAVRETLRNDFFGLAAEGVLDDLDDEQFQGVLVNVHEWLLAEGGLDLSSGHRRVADLLLGPGGPPLGVEERGWLEELVSRPLRLYEVLRVERGAGVEVRDVLAPEDGPVWVDERLGSESLETYDLVAMRLIPIGGRWQNSGAIYGYPRDWLSDLEKELRRTAAGRSGAPVAASRFTLSRLLIRRWLERFEPREPPELVDVGSGDPIALVTDHYLVADWPALEAALAARPDVDGDRRHGWNRFVELGEDVRRSLLALNPQQGDRLEAFARTLALADEGKAWLAEVAGETLVFRGREIVDPWSEPARESARRAAAADPDLGPVTVPKEFNQEVHEQIYRRWADEPVPALGGKTPRQAVRTAAGRERVAELLRTYENHEAHAARREGREPVDYAFLWRSVGLEWQEPL